jgi:hypothetical protein
VVGGRDRTARYGRAVGAVRLEMFRECAGTSEQRLGRVQKSSKESSFRFLDNVQDQVALMSLQRCLAVE